MKLSRITPLIFVACTLANSRADAFQTKEPNPEREAAIAAFWDDVLAPPDHTWRVDLGIGWRVWDRPSEGSFSTGAYRVRVGRRFGDWMGAESTLDLALDSQTGGPLTVDTTLGAWTVGYGLERWLGAVRLSALGTTGFIARTSELSDTRGSSYSGAHLDPFVGARGGLGFSFNRAVYVGFDVDLWYYAERLDSTALFSIGWNIGQ